MADTRPKLVWKLLAHYSLHLLRMFRANPCLGNKDQAALSSDQISCLKHQLPSLFTNPHGPAWNTLYKIRKEAKQVQDHFSFGYFPNECGNEGEFEYWYSQYPKSSGFVADEVTGALLDSVLDLYPVRPDVWLSQPVDWTKEEDEEEIRNGYQGILARVAQFLKQEKEKEKCS